MTFPNTTAAFSCLLINLLLQLRYCSAMSCGIELENPNENQLLVKISAGKFNTCWCIISHTRYDWLEFERNFTVRRCHWWSTCFVSKIQTLIQENFVKEIASQWIVKRFWRLNPPAEEGVGPFCGSEHPQTSTNGKESTTSLLNFRLPPQGVYFSLRLLYIKDFC